MKRYRLLILFCCAACCAAFVSCHRHGDESPKPQAYLRIDMPAHAYTLCDTAPLPFTFERSSYAQLKWKEAPGRSQDRWFTLEYPDYKGYVFLSYKRLHGPQELRAQVDTSYRFVEDNFHYSSGVDENRLMDRQHRLYGTTYHLKGQNVASTYQFWLTDSTRHFLRGVLYIDVTPNNDSLAPVLEFLQADLDHLMESVRWR